MPRKKNHPLANPFRNVSRHHPDPGRRPPTDIERLWAEAEAKVGMKSEKQAHVAGLRPDALWQAGSHKLRDGRIATLALPVCIEVDGERWHPLGNKRDRDKDARYRAAGYQVIRVWGRDIKANAVGCVLAALEAIATFTT